MDELKLCLICLVYRPSIKASLIKMQLLSAHSIDTKNILLCIARTCKNNFHI